MNSNEIPANTNPTLTANPTPSASTAKSPLPIVAIILVVALAIAIGVTSFIVISASKTNQNQPQSSEPNNNSTPHAPDQARIEDFCNSHGLKYVLVKKNDPIGGSTMDFDDIDKYLGDITINSVANCYNFDSSGSVAGIDASKTGFLDIVVYFTDNSYTGPAPDSITAYSVTEAVRLEDSPEFLKAVSRGDQNSYKYTLIYQNTVFGLEVTDINAGERILAELGYPDRSHADPSSIDDSLSKIDQARETRVRNALRQFVAALSKYQSAHNGKLPAIDEPDGMQYDIGEGYDDSEYETFFKDYAKGQAWLIDYAGRPASSFNASAKADPDEASFNPTIIVHHSATCNSAGSLISAGANNFAVTLMNSDGHGYICECNKP